MSKKFKAIFILAIILSLVVGSILFVMLKPGRWSREIISYLNANMLRDNGWVISVESLDGQFTSDVFLQNLYLKKDDGSIIIFSEESKINLDFSQILSGHWAISALSCKNAYITVKRADGQEINELAFVRELAQNGFNIRNLNVEQTSLIIQKDNEEHLYTFDLDGRVYSREASLTFSPTNLQVIDLQSKTTIAVDEGEIEFSTMAIAAKTLAGTVNQTPFLLNAEVTLLPKTEVVMELMVRGISPDDYLSTTFRDFLGAENVDIQLQLETDLTWANVDAMVYDSQNFEILGEANLHLEIDGDYVNVSDGEVKIRSCSLKGDGSLLGDGKLALNLQIDELDLEEFGLMANNTDIKGSIQLTGMIDGGKVEELTSRITLQNDNRGSERFVKATGEMIYRDNVLEFPDSLVLDFGYGLLFARGRINLNNERMNISLTSDFVNLHSLGNVFGLDSLYGNVAGSLNIVGYFRDPSVDGFITIANSKYNGTAVSSASISFLVNSLFSNRYGFLKARSSDGYLLNHPFDKGEFDVYFRGDTIQVANAKFEGKGDYLQVSGKIVSDKSIVVDQMQLSFRDQYFTNVGQIALRRIPDGLILDPVVFRLDDGKAEVSFTVQGGQLKAGTFHLVNIDLASVWSVLNTDVSIVGAAFVDFSAKTVEDHLELRGTAEVKDGFWGDLEFNNLLFTCHLENDQLYIKELRLNGPDNIRLVISGFCGVQQGEKGNFLRLNPEGQIEFSSEFRKFELSLLTRNILEGWSLSGAATGSLAMSGSAISPEMVFEFSIDKPQFSRIHGEKISGSGRYTDQRLYFEDLVGYTKTGHYTGQGYLPVDFALVPEEKDRFIEFEPVSMNFKAKTSSLDFLTPYFAGLDSIKGDISIDLSIEGTPVNPVRNGRIEIENGQIYVLMLDFPIDKVNGSAILKNNKLIIDEMTAASHVPPNAGWSGLLKSNLSKVAEGIFSGKKEKESTDNIRFTGSMDMEEFFRPNLAYLIAGEDVYVRTLLGEIEGIADLDLSVTGKDTIRIVGDVVPRESVLRIEFGVESTYEDVGPEGGTVTYYALHFPIEENLFIRNSQIDAELEGDISIFKVGKDPFRYSGELNVLDGKFYYYSDVFNIQRGHLMFDPSEFNPKIDIEATTKIEGIDILVSLSGDFKEPIVNIEDSEQYFSQSELLQLLTIQKRFVEERLTKEDLSTQPVYLVGKYLESELERSLVRATPLLDEFEIEGTSSLLGPPDDSDRAIKLGTRFSSNLYLSYKQSFSLTEREIGVEYRLNRNVSLVVTYDENGEMSLKYRRKYKF